MRATEELSEVKTQYSALTFVSYLMDLQADRRTTCGETSILQVAVKLVVKYLFSNKSSECVNKKGM